MISVREGYDAVGVDTYYQRHANDYTNPHFHIIEKLLSSYLKNNNIGNDILDLCCGSGEITKVLLKNGSYNIVGSDPYTFQLYKNQTGKMCYQHTFKDIVSGKLIGQYDTIICSFAMHLCDTSMLNTLLYQLSLHTKKLIILTPHKRPEIKSWFRLINSYELDRVKMKIYEAI